MFAKFDVRDIAGIDMPVAELAVFVGPSRGYESVSVDSR